MLALGLLSLLTLPAAQAEASPREAILLLGDGHVDAPPLVERRFPRQTAVVGLTATGKDAWDVDLQAEGQRCVIKGKGPRGRVVLTPGQVCVTDFDDGSVRGQVRALVLEGLLTRAGEVDSVKVVARLSGRVEKKLETDLFGETMSHWVPLPVPPGRASFEGHTKPPKKTD